MKNMSHSKGQNLTETFSYNSWNLLANHTINNANADVYDMSYNYSRGWHLVEKADGIKHTSDKYTYDSYYRLKEVKYDFVNNAATRTDNFYQDGVHNIEQSTENGTTFAWGVDKLNRLRNKKVGGNTAVEYDYDERNNMISEDRSGTTDDRTYIYDDLNRLIEVKDGSQNTIATYTYDAFNRRITKTVGNTIERYSYDDWNIVEIATNSNDYTNIIDSGTDRHIAIEVTANNTSTLYYFLTDERGNVTALTDESGNILERYRYRVYGDFEILDSQFLPKNCSNQTCYATNLHNFLWGGSLYEPETNLYWMRNRYYHIDMHRFINQDPIGIWGDANNLGNGFAYVAGMVIEASDPSGLDLRIFIFREFSTNFGIFGTLVVLDDEEVIFTAKVFEGRREKNKPAFSENISFLGKLQNRKFNDTGELYPIRPRIRLLEEDHISIGRQIHQGFLPSNSSGCFLIANEIINQNPKSEKDQIFDKDDSEWALSTLTDIIENLGDPVEIIIDPENNQKEELDYSSGIKQIYPNNATQKCDSIGCWCESGDCSGTAGENIPLDPDLTDGIQTYFANQFIKKILEMHEKKSFLEIMEEEGAVIKYDDNGKKVFIFNPYYIGKDPMKETIWEKQNADGTKGFVRNPFAPKAEYGYDSTTYEKWQQAGFPQTNVDPYFN